MSVERFSGIVKQKNVDLCGTIHFKIERPRRVRSDDHVRIVPPERKRFL
jgi:hypothetical protein